jgi:hypothetical protein
LHKVTGRQGPSVRDQGPDRTNRHPRLDKTRRCRQGPPTPTQRRRDPAAEIITVSCGHCPVIQYPYIGRSAAMASRPHGEQFWVVSRRRDHPAPRPRLPSSTIESCCVWVRVSDPRWGTNLLPHTARLARRHRPDELNVPLPDDLDHRGRWLDDADAAVRPPDRLRSRGLYLFLAVLIKAGPTLGGVRRGWTA